MSNVTIDSKQPYLVVESRYELARWRPLVTGCSVGGLAPMGVKLSR